MKFRNTLLFILFPLFTYSQNVTQTIRGQVTDKESKSPLVGATAVLFIDSVMKAGAVADIDGSFRIDDVPVGRVNLRFSFVGYNDVMLSNLIITAGKEVILNIEMEENATLLDAVTISAKSDRGEVNNEMAVVSVRTFSVEETDRYAGSRGDPARMASNFAGVQGADDSRNDIVVRGNSPIGVLWRLEGIDIPNPNHFAIAGTTGGPVSIINNKYLGNSDFFTGAFPAEYGNAIAGVFDLTMRRGNNEQHEFSGQIGFLGTELFAEGPINKDKKSSYLASFRYSTLQLFQFMNLSIGTSAVPNYFDGAMKMSFQTKNGIINVFGVGGKSNIDIIVSEYTKSETELYGDSDRDQYFGTSMAVGGISYGHQINPNTYGKAVIAYSWQENHANHELVYRDINFDIDSIVPNMNYSYQDQKITALYNLNKKINNRHSFKTGISAEQYYYNHIDSNLNIFTWNWDKRYDYIDNAFLFRGFFQWKYKAGERLVLNGGLHGQLFTLNSNSKAIEPRAGLRFQVDDKSSLNFGIGLHSQMLPSYQYTFQQLQADNSFVLINDEVGFIRSFHTVLGYDRRLGDNFRVKIETYFQSLYDVPVEITPSAFSLANEGSGFSRFFPDSLQNTGTGKNYGAELTLEKFFSNHFFFLATGSIYNSLYTGSDGIERKTDFNGNYAANLLGGYEIEINNRNVITTGIKFTYAGGKLATPVDTAATIAAKELIYIDSLTNTLQLKDYFRFDLKLAYRINSQKNKVTHEIAIDLVNLLNVQNVLGLTYAPNPADPSASPVKEEYQLGFLPLFYYKIDF
jgi:hypothetical protein